MTHVTILEGDDLRKTARKAVDDLGQPFWRACRDAAYVFLQRDIATVDIEVLRGVLDVVRLYANTPIVVGDAPLYGARDLFLGEQLLALKGAYTDLHFFDLTRDTMLESTFHRDEGGELLIRRAKTAVEAPLSFFLGGPNEQTNRAVPGWAFGTWIVPSRDTPTGRLWNREPWLSALTLEERERFIAELFVKYPCQAALLSGMLGERGMMASMDPVALDTLAVTLMGGDAHLVPHLEKIAGEGMWTNEIADLDIPPLVLQDFLRQ